MKKIICKKNFRRNGEEYDEKKPDSHIGKWRRRCKLLVDLMV